jgi:hypothetical protein
VSGYKPKRKVRARHLWHSIVTLTAAALTTMTFALGSYGAVDAVIDKSIIEGNINGIEYVSVRNEPQHRHEFENDKIRIYDVLLPPDYVALNHAHTKDTIYVAIQGAKVKIKPLLGSVPISSDRPIPSGIVFWNEHSKEPVIHGVTNTDTHAARLVGVELKFDQTGFTRKPLTGSGLKLRDTHKKVRVYDLELAQGERTGELTINFSGLMIALTEATVERISDKGGRQVSSLEPASWKLLDTPGKVTFGNVGVTSLKAVIYEFP